MKMHEFLGFFACFAFGFACTQSDGSDASGTVAKLCSSNDDCAVAESCDLRTGDGVCRPRARDEAAAGGGGTPGGCTSAADCDVGQECEYEHGAGYCRAHGGRDDDAYERDAGRQCDDCGRYDAGVPGTEQACTTDADCDGYYERCEYIEKGDNSGRGSNSGHGHGDAYGKLPAPPPSKGVCRADDHGGRR